MIALACTSRTSTEYAVSSPGNRLRVTIWEDTIGALWYSVTRDGQTIIAHSSLGIIQEEADLSSGLTIVGVSSTEKVVDTYETLNAKRRLNRYSANQRVFRLRNADDKGFDLVFQVSDDGIAFRYHFIGPDNQGIIIKEELTSFRLPITAKAWLQPVAPAKSGWEQTNPSYEEHYEQGIPVGTPESTNTGWIYPALFQVDSTWLLLTESGLDGRYCATRLRPESPDGEYRIGFPDPKEVMPSGGLLPVSDGPFYSPWRVLTIGSLATIVESTLGLDLAEKAIVIDEDVLKPGKSAWSWINSKDDFIVYEEQKKYIDFAADMNWQYCLIDVNWDRNIGYEKIKELADYAATKNVGLLLWYNSAGSWNTVNYTPKDKFLTSESRNEEFKRIKAMGIKGVKIDFFGGDGKSVIQYYIAILEDAAKHGLLVNFHGATLPRGWSRTYPHLMTVEAVRGFEMVTFGQEDADKQASHATILPFTRNAFDPMDFTPMNLHKIYTHVKRRTTPAFELATSVLFLSGIQHYAESPEGMEHIPENIQDFLRALPNSWDDVRFVSGFPGKDVVIARRADNRWYIAGINGEAKEKEMTIDLRQFDGMIKAKLLTDGQEFGTFSQSIVPLAETTLNLKPNGGFIMVLE
ncbi:glycoside hydrolase family 97 protein [Parapedobacter tibetensis]|uniref:glycoside hydrolase family 97 protein n=1 Tax=Parapedobacter tibetensis TaxID=2972951 RepID=UPI00214D358C|nr:glycoside hydrolase family 97 protein [Parapedobacter tibetensis]